MVFENLTVVLPTLRETTLFVTTVEEIVKSCNKDDIRELLVVVCEKTSKESLDYVEKGRQIAEKNGLEFNVLWQKRPFFGGAILDGFMAAKGSHVCVETPDWSTAPERLADMIALAKQYPNDVISLSRWLDKGSFENYRPMKKVWNYCSQKFLQILYCSRITDFTWGTHIVPTVLYQSVNFREEKHPIDLEEVVIPLRLGMKFHELPGICHIQEDDESVQPLMANLYFLRPAFRWRFAKKETLVREQVDLDGLLRKLKD